jgi:hypothetical protein
MRTDGWANKVSTFGSGLDIVLLRLELAESSDFRGSEAERRQRDADGLGLETCGSMLPIM